MDADGLPTGKLTGDSLTACEKIGSTATTVEEAKADAKVCMYCMVVIIEFFCDVYVCTAR